MKYSPLSLVALAAIVASPAFAEAPQSNVYIAGQVGWNSPTGDDGLLDNAAVFSGAIGYQAHPNFRVEGEIAYRKNDLSDNSLGTPISGDTQITNYMLNAYYDFRNESAFTPYVGGGIGVAHGSAKASALGITIKESDTAFAYQLGGGVAYSLNTNIALTADYRYLDTAEFDDIEDDYSAHEVRVGIRYSF